MIPAYSEFSSNTASLHSFLSLYDTRSAPLAPSRPSDAFAKAHRSTLYAGYVVTLYGALEKYVEDLAEWVVDKFVSIRLAGEGNRLSEQVFKDHYDRSLECLNRPDDPRYGGSLDRLILLEEMKASLHKSLASITGAVFRTHSSNLRLPVIEKMMRPLGIDVCAGLEHSGMTELAGSPAVTSEERRRKLETILKDLANARNDASHGKLGSLADVHDLEVWLKTVAQLARWLHYLALSVIVECAMERIPGCPVQASSVYRNGQVLVVSNAKSKKEVAAGDMLVSRRNGVPALMWAPVNSIMVDGNPMTRAPLDHPMEVGVQTCISRDRDYRHWIVDAQDWRGWGLSCSAAPNF